ncbi:hypothetical protein ACFYWP_39760 [Actinacidiphila glaucinigra]|uniref:hypothetical protein n=1 Tax=Actinacidiphila glaucinigra TaxID=235986 RepID=UPI0036A1ABA7
MKILTELRETAAEAEEAALRATIRRRVRLQVPDDGRSYCRAVIEARDSKLCMGHADYRTYDVELYDDQQELPQYVDLDDAVLSAALGSLAELLRPDEGAQLIVDLTDDVLN